MATSRPVAFVELHDARLRLVTYGVTPSEVRLDFEGLSVFVETAPEEFDVWSCSGTLVLKEVTELALQGGGAARDYVSDGGVLSPGGGELELAALQDPQPIREVHLQFASGAKVHVVGRFAEFAVLEWNRKVEQWRGTL